MLRDLFSLFPAYAGVIPHGRLVRPHLPPFPRIRGGDPEPGYSAHFDHKLRLSFPRIRGGDPTLQAIMQGIYNFSPHTRG